MTWKTVFQTYQNPEIGKKGKQVTGNTQQVSQFSLFPPFGEIKNHDLSLEKLKSFLGEDWNDYKNNPEALEFWANLLSTNHLMEQGKLPDNLYCNHLVRFMWSCLRTARINKWWQCFGLSMVLEQS